MRYRIFYPDGSWIDDSAERPIDATIILQRNEEGDWHLRSGGDFYTLENGVWVEHDLWGLFRYLMDSGLVLFGRTLPNERFAEVMRVAMAHKEQIND